MKHHPPRKIARSDVLAGVSVALILIPQSMAYAELAGLPPHHGLYAATFPLIAAAFLASSPYLQTGPVALTGLLTFGALVPMAPLGTAEYAALAALLALVVGVFRILVGFLKAGWVVYLMSHSMMTGFLSAAAILILCSQLPGALGSPAPVDEGVLQRAWFAVTNPDTWNWAAVGLSVFTVATVTGAASIHPLVPGVLIAAGFGLIFSAVTGYDGATVGSVPSGLPPFTLDLPWSSLPSLLLPGLVISVIGFAEGVSISRVFASEERQHWDADKEFISKGLANVVAGFSGGLPVGGSLSRTSVNRMAGARSRWSGLITGVTVLCFLPVAPVMSALPRAVLSGIVIAAIYKVVQPKQVLQLWTLSRPQALIGWTTFVATLTLSPNIDQAVLIGIALSAGVHLWRELTPRVTAVREGDTLIVEPSGVLWFASAPAMEDLLFERLADEPDVDKVVVRCTGLGRIDLTGAYVFHETIQHAERAGLEMTVEDVPDHAVALLRSVGVPMVGRDEWKPMAATAGVEGGWEAVPDFGGEKENAPDAVGARRGDDDGAGGEEDDETERD
ncbi:MAG: SulP family inorganic anion transporter [Longimicrobiales bacterium]|nr:SulP family inorganic anion transporter [Longimicrobiales bacterium]